MTIEKLLAPTERRQEIRLPMSYEQFLHELDEDIHAEWVNGEAIIFMPPNSKHQIH